MSDTTPLSEIEPSLDLRPLLEYRRLCTQLVGGIVAGNPAHIARAKAVRAELDRWSRYLANFSDDDAAANAIVADLSGESAMGVALDVHDGHGEPIEADKLDVPRVAIGA